MKIRADIRLTHLDEVMAAKEAVRARSTDLLDAIRDLECALSAMELEISQPAEDAAD